MAMLRPEHHAALGRFDTFWQKRIDARTRAETPTQTLYHYTPDLAGVTGILSECRMRFADVRNLNDKIELTYGLRLFRKIARQQFNIKHGIAGHFLKKLCDPAFVNRLFDRFHFYSASFGRRDSHHMWDAYGRGGLGFAIGVDVSLFAPNDLAAIPYDEQYFAGRLRYQQTVVRRLHKEAVEFATALVKEISSDPKIAADPEFLGDLAVRVYVDALVTSLTSKERKWSLEDEHRLFVVEDLGGSRLRTVFRPKRPYVEMTIPKRAFVEVMLGAEVTSSERDAVAKVLADHGLTATIAHSRHSKPA